MGIDTELNGANGANSEHADPDARSAQQSSAVTRKVTVKLTDQLFKRLEAATDRPGVGKSMVMEAALERFLDPAPPIEGLIHEALARITSQLERLDDDVRTIAETVALHVRWTSNDFGTVLSRIDILRAPMPGQCYSTVPWVSPGGESLLRLSGWPKVERVLQLIDAVEVLGIHPAEAAPEYWHHVHNRLSVNEAPRIYTAGRHRAWLQRRRVAF